MAEAIDTDSESIWNGFTNLYSLTKTLRFELKPIGADGNYIEEAEKYFKLILEKDTKIKESYIALKLVLDRIHENVINESLLSNEAKIIDFSGYYKEYKSKSKAMKKIVKIENELREKIVKVYNIGAQSMNKANKNNPGKSLFKKSGINILIEKGILTYIENNAKIFVDILKENEIKDHLRVFKNFFTYFQGYNQNRMNYYTKNKNETAIATRIVNDNLPKFCDNCIQFSEARDNYLKAFQELKEKSISKIPELFKISEFSECLSQSGIEKYNNNIGEYNQLINQYNNQCKSSGAKKLKPFKTLYKQIGLGKKKTLFYTLEYDTPEEQQQKIGKTEEIHNLKYALSKIAEIGNKYFTKKENNTNMLKPVLDFTVLDFINWLTQVKNWHGIYWSKDAITKISGEYFYNWQAMQEILENYLKDKNIKKEYKAVASYSKGSLKINNAVELAGLFEILNKKGNEIFKESKSINKDLEPSENLIGLICNKLENLTKNFQNQSESIMKITNYKNEDKKIKEIKEWLDTSIEIIRIIKYFDVKEGEVKGDAINPELANLISAILYSDDAKWFRWYNAVRNYLTKKPQDDAKKNKLKLNFGYPAMLDGWSEGQEKNKGGVLLKKDGKYYVGILHGMHGRTIFNTGAKIYKSKQDGSSGERFIIKILKVQTLVGKGYKKKYLKMYSKQIKCDLLGTINNVKEYIKEAYIDNYPELKEISESKKIYKNSEEFTKDLKETLTKCYKCKSKPIDWDLVLQNVGSKNIYLFEIYTKDFSNKSSGKPNLQTKYWERIFQSNTTIQLNGRAEIFFRDKAGCDDRNKIFHPANKPIYRRSDDKTASLFPYDILKDKRFTTPKYLFHVPITINYMAPVQNYKKINENINKSINKNLVNNREIHFLGIDRGEKHLIYYSLIDSKENIIEQGNFDTINNKNYLVEIDKAAKSRRDKQENWQQKSNISNLKGGYISLVIHNIIEKMKDAKTGEFVPTFIVLEDLNKGFKRSRQRFEIQVYQKFELALAKKLNYLVDKNSSDNSIGSIAKALQLTPPVNNYKDIEKKKQFGIMLYVPPNYTSITDPVTGWHQSIYFKGLSKEEEDIRKNILETFSKIEVDENGDYSFEYKDENGKAWTLWSSKSGKSLERYYSIREKNTNKWDTKPYNTKEELDKLFKNFDKKKLISEQLKEYKDQFSWDSLLNAIKRIQQIRNSGDLNKNQDENFLLSPVRDQNGNHFDTRIKSKKSLLPDNADANGAYNIARKGIIMYEHIKRWIDDSETGSKKSIDPNLFVSDKEWNLWTTNRNLWERKSETFIFKKIK